MNLNFLPNSLKTLFLLLLAIIAGGVKLSAQTYCAPTASVCDERISNFVLNTISNNSGTNCGTVNNGYSDYTSTFSTTLTMTLAYTATITVSPSYGSADVVDIYIDYNHDGVFDPATELIGSGNCGSASTFSIPIVIPTSAQTGNTRLRARLWYASEPGPCNSTTYGEAEDYTVNILPLGPCTGSPNASTITSAPITPLCSGGTAVMSATNPNPYSGIKLQWMQSSTGLPGTWTNVVGGTGANTSTYTTAVLTNTTYFMLQDSCLNTNQATPSTNIYTVQVNSYSIPYTEFFNTTANTTIPYCYTQDYTGAGISKWQVYNSINAQFHDGNGVAYPWVMAEDDQGGNANYGKNAYFTLPALPLNAGETYRIRFGYERGRSDATTTNVGAVYNENLAMYENFNSAPSNTSGIPGGASAIPLFATVVTTDGHNTASLTFTPAVSGAYFFSWYSNTPHPTGANPTLIAGGLIAVDSIRIDSFGCNPPAITFQPQNSAVCLNGNISLSVQASGYNLSYQWYKNNALISGANSSVLNIINAQAGDAAPYRVTVTGTCGGTQSIQSNTVNLIVSAYPTDSLASNKVPAAICAGDSVKLTAYTAVGNSYQWKLNGNFIPNAFSSGYTALTGGSYQSVSTNQYGCATTSAAIPVTVLSASSVSISPSGPSTFCNGGSVVLTANTGTGISYQWLLNGVAVVPANTTNTLTTSTSGNYTVKETAASNGCSVTFPTAIPVIVNGPTAPPAISVFNNSPLSFCLGGSVTLQTPNVTAPAGQPAYSYQWYKDSVAINQATGINYLASASGKYFVAVSQNNCALKSSSDTVVVDAPPTTVTNNGTVICSNNTILLQAAGGTGLGYKWYNNGVFTGVTTQTYADTVAGNFQVQVTDAFPCVASSSVTTVTVGAPPSAVILATGPTTFCPGGSVKIRTNYDTSLSYIWSVSPTQNGNFSNLPTLAPGIGAGHYDSTRIFNATGWYRVSEANGPCQSVSDPIHIIVSPLPTPVIASSGSDSLCPGGSVTLSVHADTNATYQWIKDAVNVPGAIGPTFVVNSSNVNPGAAGSSLKLVETNGTGCTGTAGGVTVTVYNYPADSIVSSGSDTICAGSSVTLQAPTPGAGYQYKWYQNNQLIQPAFTGSYYVASSSGSYKVAVTSPQGCTATTPVGTVVNVVPVPSTNVTVTSGSTTFCTGSSVTLTTTAGSGYTYQWQRTPTPNGGNITNLAGANGPSYVDSISGYYRVVISNGICAVASIVTPVTVNTPPAVSATAAGNTTFCQNGQVLLNASVQSSGNVSYQWKVGNNNINTGGTLSSYNATTAGTYTVVATTGANCVSVSNPVTVTVNPLPKDTVALAAGSHNPTCANVPAVLIDKNSAAGYSYQWKLNGANIPGATNAQYATTDSGLYSFSVTDNNGCTNSSPATIGSAQVYHLGLNPVPNPVVNTSLSPALSTGTFVTYQWQLNDANIADATSNGYTAKETGNYRVVVTNGYGCVGTSDEANVAGGVGVKNVAAAANIRIYPNPATSIVHIDAPMRVNVTVSALDGKRIVEGNGVTQVDLTGLANGVYMITVYDENRTIMKIEKLVKTGI